MDLVPKKKPEKSKTDADYKKRINSLLIGFYGTGPEYRGLAVDEIQKTLDEADQKGVLSKQDGLSFVQERKKHYDSYFADRAQKQRLRGVIEEGLSTVERPEFELGGSTDYRAMVTRMYIEAGGQEGTGMDIESFAAAYFPKMANGGRIGFDKGTEPKTSPVKTDVYKYPVGNKFGTRYAKEPRGNQYTKKSGISLQTDEYKNKIAKEIKDNFLRYNDVKKEYGKKTADIFKGQYPKVGKNPSKEGKKLAEIKRGNWIKEQSSVSMLQKLSGDKGRGGVQLSHLFSKNVPDSLKTLGYLPTDKNIKSYHKFEKPLTTAMDKVYSELDKKKTSAQALLAAFKKYQTEDRKLRSLFPQYKDTKSRLSFKRTAFDPSGIMVKEILRNPNLAISKEPGTQLKGVMPSSEKGKGILSIGADKLKKFRMPGGSGQDPYKDPLGGPDLIDIRKILRND